MKEGAVYRRFEARDGRQVTLRAARWSDLDDLLSMINSLIEEEADIVMDTPQTREQEIEWLSRTLASQEKDQHVTVVAEVDDHAVGNSDVHPMMGRGRHVGNLGIVLRDGYRDTGIGKEMMRELETQSKRIGLTILVLGVYSSNRRAIHVYESMGYRRAGVVPGAARKSAGYVDEIRMYKPLTPQGE